MADARLPNSNKTRTAIHSTDWLGLMNDKCTICGNPVTGLMVGTGNGVAHSECYEREHPPRTACTLYQVARGCGDPVLAAEIIAALVPPELAETIVEHFNKALLKQWLRRCSPNVSDQATTSAGHCQHDR